MHEALARLGVPPNATDPRARLRHRQFHGAGARPASDSSALSSIRSPAASPARCTRPPTSASKTSAIPSCRRIDAVIGNVPFADVKLEFHGRKLSLHDFFIAKSVDALKPGGVLAVVTSHFTLDKQNAAVREHLAAQADFLGAIRLPSDAFKREGTSVVTDIVFLRKRATGQAAEPRRSRMAAHRQPFRSPEPTSRSTAISIATPRWCWANSAARTRSMAARGSASSATATWPQQLKDAINRLPKFQVIQSQAEMPNPPPAFIPPPPERHIAEGSFFVGDDKVIHQVEDGRAVPVTYGGTLLKADGTMTGKRLAALVGLRDLARRVLQSQNEGWPEAEPQPTPARSSTGPMTCLFRPTARSTRRPSAKPPTAR